MNKALFSSQKMDWCTPDSLFEKLNKEFHFVLDAAATDQNAKCGRYFTPETDGLSQSWDCGGAVFCNPPYGRDIGKWVKKAYEESIGGGGRLSYLSRQGRIQLTFTTMCTAKQNFVFCADVLSLLTSKAMNLGRPRFLPCWLFTMGMEGSTPNG